MESVYGRCPFATTQNVLQGKWAIVVLYQLSTGTKRFSELEKLIPEVARPVLTRQLRQLEENKLIARKVFAQVPPRVEYRLTPLGDKFKNVLNEIEAFGLEYMKELNIVAERI